MVEFVIGGNWKMQLGPRESAEVARELVGLVEDYDGVTVFIAPSFLSIPELGKILEGTPVKLAAQNMCEYDKGAYTGEIAAEWLKECGCEYVILGHSERRHIFGESDDRINKKVLKALGVGLKPVLCIGETAAERQNGLTEEVNRRQLENGLKGLDKEAVKNIVIAYEPVWAINSRGLNPTGEIRPATPKEAEEVHNFIRDWLVGKYGEAGKEIPIQYGGSMKPSNCRELLAIKEINGGLVGSASLKPSSFIEIIKTAAEFAVKEK